MPRNTDASDEAIWKNDKPAFLSKIAHGIF